MDASLFRSLWLPARTYTIFTLWTVLTLGVANLSYGQIRASADPAPDTDEPDILRELHVPLNDLPVIIKSDPKRVFMARDEYEQLKTRAKQRELEQPPRASALTAAQFELLVSGDRAHLQGEILIDVLTEPLQRISLPIKGVALLSAKLADKPAPLGQGTGHVDLFLAGKGPQRLQLEGHLPVRRGDANADRELRFRLPPVGAGTVRLIVPGDVELRAGPAVLSRNFDATTNRTQFLLPLTPGELHVVIGPNQQQESSQASFVAHSLLINEVTTAYERLHARLSVHPTSGRIRQFSVLLPDQFDVLSVHTTQLQKWEMDTTEGRRTLTITLREPTADLTVVRMLLQRATSRVGEPWTFPWTRPVGAQQYSTVVGLVLEPRLSLQEATPERMIPFDVSVLESVLPEELRAATDDAAARTVAAYYAPWPAAKLTGQIIRPPGRLDVTSTIRLRIDDDRWKVDVRYFILPLREKVHECDLLVPADWTVDGVSFGDGGPLPFELYPAPDGGQRVHIQLPRGVPPEQPYIIQLQALHIPQGWLGSWDEMRLPLPDFTLVQASRQQEALAVNVNTDVTVRLDAQQGVWPLDGKQKSQFFPNGVRAELAAYLERPYDATLIVQRREPRIQTETFSFFRIQPDLLNAHYELVFNVQQAKTGELFFSLPADTPDELEIRAVRGADVKQSQSTVEGDRRRWKLLLDGRVTGPVHVVASFRQPIQETSKALPIVRAESVAYQSGYYVVEGDDELDLTLQSTARAVDIGETAAATYRPGRHVLGVFAFVDTIPQATVRIERPDIYGLPVAIIERADLKTVVSSAGTSHTEAVYRLRTKSPHVLIKLPPDARLWAIRLDGQPSLPHADSDFLRIPVPPNQGSAPRQLQFVYETPAPRFGLRSMVHFTAPQLALRQATSIVTVPAADLQWEVHVPFGYRMISSDGTLVVSPETRRGARWTDPAWQRWSSGVKQLVGGIDMAYEGSQGNGDAQRMDGIDRPPFEDAAASDRDSLSTESEPQSDSQLFHMPESSTATSDGGLQNTADDAKKDRSLGLFAGPAVDAAGTTTAEPSAATPSTNAPQPSAAQRELSDSSRTWAELGKRSLDIHLADGGQRIVLRSLGAEPEIRLSLMDARRWSLTCWSAAWALLAVGVTRIGRPLLGNLRWLLAVAVLVGTIRLCLSPESPWILLADRTIEGGLWLLGIYLSVAAVRGTVRLGGRWLIGPLLRLQRARVVSTTLPLLTLATLLTATTYSVGQETQLGPLTIRLQPGSDKVTVPDDAIIVPYDTESNIAATRILVPYDQYVRLREQVEAQASTAANAPAPFAVAAASWQTSIQDADTPAIVDGTLSLHLFVDGPVLIPLSLDGGVIIAATLDGQPANVTIAYPEQTAVSAQRRAAQQQVAQQAVPQRDGGGQVAILAQGLGPHRLNLTMRFPVNRQGGWRVATGKLPAAATTELAVQCDPRDTRVELHSPVDRTELMTEDATGTSAVALPSSGEFTLRWRPQTTDRAIDRGMQAESQQIVDVQEDSVRITAKLDIRFPQSQRDQFRIAIADGYFVERVDGADLASWQMEQGELSVRLAQAAESQYSLRIAARKAVANLADLQTYFSSPTIDVPAAVAHEGTLIVRRSPLIQLEIQSDGGARRVALPESLDSFQLVSSPLGVTPFQSYRFARLPLGIRLRAVPVPPGLRGRIMTVVQLSPRKQPFRSHIQLTSSQRPMHELELEIVDAQDIDEISSNVAIDWAVRESGDKHIARIRLLQGRRGAISLTVVGSVRAGETYALPRVLAPAAVATESFLVVQAAPSFDVQPAALTNLQTTLPGRVYGELPPEERPLVRLVLASNAPDYRGQVRLVRRQAIVHCKTITNVRVTRYAVEETVLLDFDIRQAGVRQLEFLVPERLQAGRVEAPLVQEIERQAQSIDGQRFTRFRLKLQDEIMGQFRVLLEHDEPVGRESVTITVPHVTDARSVVRLLALETAGRDEIRVQQVTGFSAVDSGSRYWRQLQSVLGEGVSRAYLAGREGISSITLTTKVRQQVQTVGARIPFARARLVVDASGTFRGEQEYRVDNRTEQYLAVQLPSTSQLWSALVDGQPVKPALSDDGAVLVPLIKTSEGESDYPVMLKYAGQLPPPSTGHRIEFPLLRSVNIRVEKCQVRLQLPETHRWTAFEGTLTQAESERQLLSSYLEYKYEQLVQAEKTLKSANPFARLRARYELEELSKEVDEIPVDRNAAMGRRLRGKLQQLREQPSDAVAPGSRGDASAIQGDNREQLNEYFFSQSNVKALDIPQSDEPWGDRAGEQSVAESKAPPERTGDRRSADLQTDWFFQNGLAAERVATPTDEGRGKTRIRKSAAPRSEKRETVERFMKRLGNQTVPQQTDAAGEEQERAGQGYQEKSSPEVDRLRRYDRLLRSREEQPQRAPTGGIERGGGLGGGLGGGGFAGGGRQSGVSGQSTSESLEGATSAAGQQFRSGQDRAQALNVPSGAEDALTITGAAAAPAFGEAPPTAPGEPAGPPSGLVSLDVQLPDLGRQYLFTASHGDLQLTARPVSRHALRRGSRLVSLTVLLLIVVAIRRRRHLSGASVSG